MNDSDICTITILTTFFDPDVGDYVTAAPHVEKKTLADTRKRVKRLLKNLKDITIRVDLPNGNSWFCDKYCGRLIWQKLRSNNNLMKYQPIITQ